MSDSPRFKPPPKDIDTCHTRYYGGGLVDWCLKLPDRWQLLLRRLDELRGARVSSKSKVPRIMKKLRL